ncbi:MAG TPA: BON domain-containing protein [Pyrinomonadaceae bacterium]|jgi:osmotically-inducible protein OsmY
MKRNRLLLILGIAALALAAACNNTSNENANANATPAATATPASANANTARRGTREEYEKNKETYGQQAKDLGRKVGNGLNDGWLWTKTRFDLAAADDLRDSTINVDVENEVVTLSGTVATAAQKAKAESIAKSVAGVKQVKNMLKVAPAANTNTNTKANANTKKSK